MTLPLVENLKARIGEPVRQANVLALAALGVAIVALLMVMGKK